MIDGIGDLVARLNIVSGLFGGLGSERSAFCMDEFDEMMSIAALREQSAILLLS